MVNCVYVVSYVEHASLHLLTFCGVAYKFVNTAVVAVTASTSPLLHRTSCISFANVYMCSKSAGRQPGLCVAVIVNHFFLQGAIYLLLSLPSFLSFLRLLWSSCGHADFLSERLDLTKVWFLSLLWFQVIGAECSKWKYWCLLMSSLQ